MERNLTEEEKEVVINAGALGYSAEQLAPILMLHAEDLKTEMNNPMSDVARLYAKGLATANYLIDLKLFEMAKSGDLKALEKFEHRKRMGRRK